MESPSEGSTAGAPAEVGDQASQEPPGGCAAHGVALLLASSAAVVLMAAVTVGCWLLYGLFT